MSNDLKILKSKIFKAVTFNRYVGMTVSALECFLEVPSPKKITLQTLNNSLQELVNENQIIKIGKRLLLHPEQFQIARGSAKAPEFSFADTWILKSVHIQGSQKPCSLADIIAVADAINHAIPNHDEMFVALNHLHSAKLIRKRKHKYLLASRGKEIFDKVSENCGKRLWDQMDGIKHLLRCPVCGVDLKRVSWQIIITENDDVKAYGEYQELFRRTRKK